MKKDFGPAATALPLASPAISPVLHSLLRPPPQEAASWPVDRVGRLRIWEIRGASLCSIVGTCLTLGELRKISRKCRFIDEPDKQSDYEIHGKVTAQMNTDNHVARAVTKHLDLKFEGAIRKTRALDGDEAILGYWESAIECGLVPDAYWALLTHPGLSLQAEARIYGEIHMMSHMCGASNRGDARVIAEVRREKDEAARRLSTGIAERDRRLDEHRREIERLKSEIRALEPVAAECERLRRLISTSENAAERAADARELAALREENASLRRTCSAHEFQCERLIARLERRSRAAERPERRAAPPVPPPDACPAEIDPCPTDLCGRCVLYVGGRRKTVCRLKELVAKRNGVLLHHDGGLENSAMRLGEMVSQADEVYYPVDCVSHKAVDVVKKLCDNYGKQMRPLRSSSTTTFLRAIDGGADRPSTPAAN